MSKIINISSHPKFNGKVSYNLTDITVSVIIHLMQIESVINTTMELPIHKREKIYSEIDEIKNELKKNIYSAFN